MKTLYYNGDILTLEEPLYAKAILINNGKIEKVFYNDIDINNFNAELLDLKGNTLMPGFIDAHSHISALATALGLVDLSVCTSIEQIQEKLLMLSSLRFLLFRVYGFQSTLHPCCNLVKSQLKFIYFQVRQSSQREASSAEKAIRPFSRTLLFILQLALPLCQHF